MRGLPLTLLLCLFLITSFSQAPKWSWINGDSSIYSTTVYGTKGIEDAANNPGFRYQANTWADAGGNAWVYGGSGYNDMWKFNKTTGLWSWMSGSSAPSLLPVYGTKGIASATNNPARPAGSAAWQDASGNFWLFGGNGTDISGNGYLNTLWKYNPTNLQWTWISGDQSINQPGVYGTKGVASSGNKPGSRSFCVASVDASGIVWMFGGTGKDAFGNTGPLNDLWKYNPSTNQWTWVSGLNATSANSSYGTKGVSSASNLPPARDLATAWVDNAGKFWMFGGTTQFGGYYNDLWVFNPATQQWTWMAGDNTITASGVYGTKGIAAAVNKPGSRMDAKSWKDASGNLWLFGGQGQQSNLYGNFNDVWKYNITTNQWTWMHGGNTVNQNGIYNTIGVADASGTPSARWFFGGAGDMSGNFWIYGGLGTDNYGNGGTLDDLWQFNSSTNQWTWKSGHKLITKPGAYGAKGIASNINQPSKRTFATARNLSGKMVLFGGTGVDANGIAGNLNDLWSFDPTTNQWTWIDGDNSVNQPGVYGTKRITAAGNKPGARQGSVSWKDASGNFWLFGGFGIDQFSGSGQLNDLWKYNCSTKEWTWMAGDSAANQTAEYGTKGISSPANKPAGRSLATGWIDNSGNVWVFGGQSNGSYLNDLWKFDISTNQWIWVGGNNTSNPPSVYGTLGISNAVNTPGGRATSSGWMDSAGNLWLFGGIGFQNYFYNDLWKFNTSTNEWTWVNGDNTNNPGGVYGTMGVPGTANKPSGRMETMAWASPSGDFMLYGGRGNNVNNSYRILSEVWQYNPGTNEWTWLSGSNIGGETSYGIKGAYQTSNTPGARYASAIDVDAAGNIWLYSGSNGTNDLWLGAGPLLSSGFTILGDTIFCSGTNNGTYLTIDKIEGAQYLWLKNGIPIEAAVDTGYFATTSGIYSIRVYNAIKSDSVTSVPFQVTALSPPAKPAITANGPVNLCNGDSVILSSSATINNQWYKDGITLNGEINQTYTVSSAGNYFVVDSNTCGSTASEIITITISNTPLNITAPSIYFSGDTILCPNTSVTLFTPKITGVSYLWLKDNTPINIANENDTAYVATSAGQYSVRIYNTCNNDSATSRSVTVTVNNLPQAPAITANGPTTICSVDSVKLISSVAANYQWYKNDVIIPGAASRSYTVYSSGSYKVYTTNNCGTSYSDSITVTFFLRPSNPVISAIGSTSICQGDSVQLSTPLVNGLTYQWKKSGVPISGATSTTYIVKETGNYSVTASNGFCTSTSSSVAVLVSAPPPAPTITSSGSGTICQGNSITLNSSASSGNQWYKDGIIINGAGGTSYNATLADIYTVRVTSNGCASAPSNIFSVTRTQTEISISSVSATPATLWPPDHRMVDVQIDYVSTSNCGTPGCVLSVTSNELQSGLGGGDVDNDWQIIDAHHVRLRAERSANGNGRMYTVSIKCGISGDTTIKNVSVYVQNKPIVITTQSNPTSSSFILTVQSSTSESINMRVLNMDGNMIEYKANVQPNSPIVLGTNYEPGLYYVEFIQGGTKEVVKLMKLGL